jgi:hypothetical protein
MEFWFSGLKTSQMLNNRKLFSLKVRLHHLFLHIRFQLYLSTCLKHKLKHISNSLPQFGPIKRVWRYVLIRNITELAEVTDKLYHIMLNTSPWSRFDLTISVVIGTDCIGSYKSNYHTITATTDTAFYLLDSKRPSWPWSYGNWIYNCLCNQYLSPLILWGRISIRARCLTLCDKVCQLLPTVQWYSGFRHRQYWKCIYLSLIYIPDQNISSNTSVWWVQIVEGSLICVYVCVLSRWTDKVGSEYGIKIYEDNVTHIWRPSLHLAIWIMTW